MSCITAFLARLGMAIIITVPAVAQSGKKQKLPKWKIDPYTKNEPAAMEKAGYVSFGPFGFGEHAGKDVSTARIEAEMGKGVRFRWVETKHFKLGSALEKWIIPMDREVKKKLRAELKELKKKIPRIKVKVKALDPWLRLHLFAHRLEKLYADFSKRLGVKDDSFPSKRGTYVDGRYMGEGPYIGQPAKYTVLLCHRSGDYTRYLRTYIGMAQTFAKRHNYKIIGSLFVGTASELYEGQLKHDTAMHTHVFFNVVQQLINGFKFYTHDLPVWFKEGMAHWYGRNVSRKYNNFDQNESTDADLKKTWRWKAKVRALVVMNTYTPAADMLTWRDYGQITFKNHMLCWSRIDYLMTLGDEKFSLFLHAMKGVIDQSTNLASGKEILKLQRKALKESWRINALTFDEKWKEYVLSTYPVR